MSVIAGNNTNLKTANRIAIGNLLMQKSPLTKQEIARMTLLSFSAVSNLIVEMQQDNLVREVGLAESGGGRRAVLYEINPLAYIVAGVDIQVERLAIVLAQADGTTLCTYHEPIDVNMGPEWTVERISKLIAWQMEGSVGTPMTLSGIGISIPGPINLEHSMVLSPPNMPGWKNVPLKNMMEAVTGVPCLIEKDANAAAYGECKYGTGKGIEHLLYVMADTGIGGALIINGNIYAGAFNDAGDIGHVPIDINGPKCNCGATGCVEAVASGLAIQREIHKRKNRAIPLDEVLNLCDRDVDVSSIVSNAARYLGYVVGGLTNALNVSTVILGGSLLERSDLYFQTTVESMKKQILPEFLHQVHIERPQLGGFSGAIGAARLVIQNLQFSG